MSRIVISPERLFFLSPSLDVRLQQTVSSGANTADRAGNESNEDSDSELQEVYVQAYACKVFNDAAAAAAVEGGEHLRPLAVPQVMRACISYEVRTFSSVILLLLFVFFLVTDISLGNTSN